MTEGEGRDDGREGRDDGREGWQLASRPYRWFWWGDAFGFLAELGMTG